MKFADIRQFPQAYYKIDVNLDYVEDTLNMWNRPAPNNLILDPDWQRGHVWDENQSIKFLEYFLRGGTTGRTIFFNCSSWENGYDTPVYVLDGLQRITAAKRFINNEIPAFGAYRKEYADLPRITNGRFEFVMLAVKNKRELLEVYINHNSAGVKHSKKELDRIQKMLDNTPEDETL